jgi:hypothetical protein
MSSRGDVMHITNRNPEPQSTLTAVSIRTRSHSDGEAESGNGSTGAPAPGLGNRVYELGVRTERDHGSGLAHPLDRAEDPIALLFARKPDPEKEKSELADARDWISERRQKAG